MKEENFPDTIFSRIVYDARQLQFDLLKKWFSFVFSVEFHGFFPWKETRIISIVALTEYTESKNHNSIL